MCMYIWRCASIAVLQVNSNFSYNKETWNKNLIQYDRRVMGMLWKMTFLHRNLHDTGTFLQDICVIQCITKAK